MKKNTLPGRDGAEGGIGKCVLRRANHLNMTILSPLAYSFHASHLHHGSPALVMDEWVRGRYLISKQRFIAHSGRHELWLNWEDNLPMSVITQGFKFGKQKLLWLSGGTEGELASMGVLWQCWGWLCMQSHEDEWTMRVWKERERDRWGRRGQAEILCIFFLPLTLWDPKRGPASSPKTFLISVLRRPCHFMGILFFWGGGRGNLIKLKNHNYIDKILTTIHIAITQN